MESLTTAISVQVDRKDKELATSILSNLGLNMSTYVNMAIKQLINEDYKTRLQEIVQTDRKSLEYVLVREYGEAHKKRFVVEVKIDNIIYGKGTGKSKKEAEQKAAYDALSKSAR